MMHAVALKSDGTVWTWGNNAVGQLGDGTLDGPTCPDGLSVCKTAPVQVVGLTNVIAIRASGLYTIALKDDGSLWTWGFIPANQGALGTGEPGGTHPVPVPVIDIAQVGWSGSTASPPLAFSDAAMSAFATHSGHTLAMGAVTGGNISVRPVESGAMSNEVTLTFSNLITPGVTTLTRSGGMPPLPSGFSFGNPQTFYDIQTSAEFTGPITLCITFVPSSFPAGTTPTILHFDQSSGTWEALAPSTITTTATGMSTICAPTTSLSPFALVVADSIAPTLHVTLSAATLSPANHKLVPVTATVHVSDNADANPRVELVSITITDAGVDLTEEDLRNDIQHAAVGTDDREFALRAQRSGRGPGRTYTVTYAATDMAGNRSEVSRIVFVPHDRRKR